jgi:hypothetical protein
MKNSLKKKQSILKQSNTWKREKNDEEFIHKQKKQIGAGKLNEKWENPEKKNCNLCKKKKFFVVAYII